MPHGLPTEPTDTFPYRIEREAGAGAMGVVYRAVEPLLDRPVAIKVLKSNEGKESEAHQRFLQEARAAAGLSHPGVTTVFRVGELDGGSPYLVMEWLDGRTLDSVLKQRGSLPFEEASRIILELLDALAAAHRAGVVHRDLKPSNLVILESGRLKVMDFGIALLQGRKLVETMVGTVLATPQFASPEQLQGKKLDGRSDLFSATLLFYYLLSEKLPFKAKHLGELLNAVIGGSPIPITQRRQDLRPEVDSFFERGLAKEIDDRFPNADAMADALRRLSLPQTDSAYQQAVTTRMVSPPHQFVTSADIASSWLALQATIRTWPKQELGTQPLQSSLVKLLDKPFHTAAFAGAAHFGDACLLVADGVILAKVDINKGTLDPDGELPDEAPLRLFPAPADAAESLPSLVGALIPGPSIHDGLDTELVDLPGLVGRQLDDGFDGHMCLTASGAKALLIFHQGSCRLAVLGGAWSHLSPADWSSWLGSVRAKIRLQATRVCPPASWYRVGYAGVDFSVHRVRPEVPKREGTGALANVMDTAAHRAGSRFFQLNQESGPSALARTSIDQAPARRILGWMFDQLPYELAERKKTAAWKYLGDWLIQARKARLHSDVQRPGTGITDSFDLIIEDDDGKVLHLAHRCGRLDAETLKNIVDRAIAAKESRTSTGDIGAVLVVSPQITPAAEEVYRGLLRKGLGKRLFGIDKSTGYEGFVRLSARRGFHLMLVEEHESSFKPRFEP